MRLLTGGSLKEVARDPALCEEFVAALGQEIVKQKHVLLHGCRGSLDRKIATAANEWLVSNGGNPQQSIVGYCTRGRAPDYSFGTIRESSLPDWNMNHPELNVPEQIGKADVTIFVAGGEGTFWAKNWAFYARKPIMGIPRFGGAGETIFDLELRRLRVESPAVVEEYESLNQISRDISLYAQEVVALAERLVAPRSVFTIMSFKREFYDVYASYAEICRQFGFQAERTDESASLERIVPRVERGIKQCAFVLADVTEMGPNVFYEVGLANGLGKQVIMTAKKGTQLPFDVSDFPVIFWEAQEDLKEGLRKRLAGIKGKAVG